MTVPDWRARFLRLIAASTAARAAIDAERARVEAHLGDGFTNTNLLLDDGRGRWVLRLGNAAATQLGVQRGRERRVWRAAARAGLGPPPLAFDAATGDALAPFEAAPSLAQITAARSESPAMVGDVRALAAALRAVHALDVSVARVDATSRVLRLVRLGERHDADWAAAVRRACIGLGDEHRAASALVHGDFNPWNLLAPNAAPLRVLDWEYAARGDPLFDVATVIAHWSLRGAERAAFLAACGVGPDALSRLAAASARFHLREYAWAGAMAALDLATKDTREQFDRERAWLVAEGVLR